MSVRRFFASLRMTSRSVFWKSCEVALGSAVPAEAGERIAPPALHGLQGTLVRCVTARDHFLEVTILRLYHLIGVGSLERKVTRSTHLLACHRLHDLFSFFLLSVGAGC